MKRFHAFFFSIVILYLCFILTGCKDNPTDPGSAIIDLSNELSTASPASQNIDASQLEAAYQKAGQTTGLQSLLVLRNGLLVAEEYFSGYNENRLNHVRSVTKSVISTLIGIAIEKGFLQNTNQTLAEYLGPYAENLDAQKGQITIEQLLTMTSGFSWNETGGNEYSTWRSSVDQINYVIDKPLVATPGLQFNYNSGAVHLLSVILTRATGMSTLDFADKYLFGPLGISIVAWEQVSGNFYNGGAGLQFTARDMAKFGLLFLQNGFSGDQEIVPSAWVQQSWQQHQTLGFSFGAMQSVHYGYLWWMDKGQNHDAFLAWGYGGQFVYCVPDLNLVVIATSRWQLAAADASAQEQANLDLIINNVLPAVK